MANIRNHEKFIKGINSNRIDTVRSSLRWAGRKADLGFRTAELRGQERDILRAGLEMANQILGEMNVGYFTHEQAGEGIPCAFIPFNGDGPMEEAEPIDEFAQEADANAAPEIEAAAPQAEEIPINAPELEPIAPELEPISDDEMDAIDVIVDANNNPVNNDVKDHEKDFDADENNNYARAASPGTAVAAPDVAAMKPIVLSEARSFAELASLETICTSSSSLFGTPQRSASFGASAFNQEPNVMDHDCDVFNAVSPSPSFGALPESEASSMGRLAPVMSS